MHARENGSEIKILATFGFDKLPRDGGRVVEFFCADFKAGSDTQALVTDACVIGSMLLQYGVAAEKLAEATCRPPSLLGSLLLAAAEVDRGKKA